MSRRRRAGSRLTDLAANLCPEDGSDPKEFHRKPWYAPKAASRKALQLCGQVKDALISILAACGDEVLQAAMVLIVEPAPHSGRLRVQVAFPTDSDLSRSYVESHLKQASGLLRAEVAAAINRRHAPELAFAVIG